MRWKEKFLVPDHRVDSISGASFAGFYYICYQRSTNQIRGYYFYRHNTEWYQELFLKHSDQSSFTSYEFRWYQSCKYFIFMFFLIIYNSFCCFYQVAWWPNAQCILRLNISTYIYIYNYWAGDERVLCIYKIS
jgi:hypothetical protein